MYRPASIISAGRVPFFCLSLFYNNPTKRSLVSPCFQGIYIVTAHRDETHVQHKDAELRLGVLALEAQLLPGGLDVLLQLLDGVLEGGSGVVDLVDDEDLLAYEVLHLAEAGQVEPLGAGDLLARLLHDAIAEGLVERQANSLDRDVGAAGLLEEGSQDAGGHVTTAADGDHEVGLEVVEDVRGGLLAELVDLEERKGLQVRNAHLGGVRVCMCSCPCSCSWPCPCPYARERGARGARPCCWWWDVGVLLPREYTIYTHHCR